MICPRRVILEPRDHLTVSEILRKSRRLQNEGSAKLCRPADGRIGDLRCSKRWSRSSSRPTNQCTTTPYNKFDSSAYYSHNNYYDNYTRATTHNDVNCGTDNYCCAYYNINTNNNNNN